MFKRKVISLLVIAALVVGISGCNLVKVDPERDMQLTIFKTKEGKVQKKEFVNYLTYYELVYKLNGAEMPTGEELTELKENLVNSLVEINVLKDEAVKNKYTVDISTVDEEVQGTITQFKEGLEGEEAYVKFIEAKNLTKTDFESFLKQYVEDVKYANAAVENQSKELQKSGKEAAKTIVTVDKEKLKKDEFYYKLSQVELSYYANYGQGLPTDEESINTIYGQIQDEMAQSVLVQKDAQTKKIILQDKDVQAKQDEIKAQYTGLIGEDKMSEYLANYYLTPERFDELIKYDAKTRLYEESISKSFETETTITEKEIKEYYETKKTSYDTSTVSAKHILTTDEAFAKEISAEITNAKTFEAAFKKYEDNEKVTEASDLGAFKYTDMVSEFSVAAFGLEKGGVSKPIKSEFGYHIIYVYDTKSVKVPTLAEKTKEIKDTLMSQKVSTKMTDYKTTLASKAKITKEKIEDPFKLYVENLKEEYKVKTYPKRLN